MGTTLRKIINSQHRTVSTIYRSNQPYIWPSGQHDTDRHKEAVKNTVMATKLSALGYVIRPTIEEKKEKERARHAARRRKQRFFTQKRRQEYAIANAMDKKLDLEPQHALERDQS